MIRPIGIPKSVITVWIFWVLITFISLSCKLMIIFFMGFVLYPRVPFWINIGLDHEKFQPWHDWVTNVVISYFISLIWRIIAPFNFVTKCGILFHFTYSTYYCTFLGQLLIFIILVKMENFSGHESSTHHHATSRKINSSWFVSS